MGAMRRLGLVSAVLLAATTGRADAAPPKPSAEAKAAIRDYLQAGPTQQKAALSKALGLLKDDVALAAEALRALGPLEKAKPGAHHGKTFTSGGTTWEYSVLLPEGYDGETTYPVLVLPDHGTVDGPSGIGFWEGAKHADEYVVFRPVITRFQQDAARFPDQQFFARDAAMARVMGDALATLRLRYAVDPDRFVMTGLSQGGYYTWYYAVTFPDSFAGIVPESAGGIAVRAAVLPLARNLLGLSVRILHAEGDQVCPFEDAKAMRGAIESAGGKAELIAYTDEDYGAAPFPNRHPGPHDKRYENVLPWGLKVRRTIPTAWTRVIRYGAQGFEGRFRVAPPAKPTEPFTLTCREKDGILTADRPDAVYLVAPEDVVAGREFRAKGRVVKPRGDVRLLLETFKATGDLGRLAAAEIPCGK
jgi:dienelactone hydrolase